MVQVTINLRDVGVAVLVLLATYGGHPTPPAFFTWFADTVPLFKKLFQYFFYSLLVYLVLGPTVGWPNVLSVSFLVLFFFEMIRWIETLYA